MTTSMTIGKRYQIRVELEPPIMVMQYNFKPASIDNAKHGTLFITQSSEAHLRLPTTGAATDHVTLGGTSSLTSATEKLLVFNRNDGSLVLRNIAQSITGLKHKHTSTTSASIAKPRNLKALKSVMASKNKQTQKKIQDAASALGEQPLLRMSKRWKIEEEEGLVVKPPNEK